MNNWQLETNFRGFRYVRAVLRKFWPPSSSYPGRSNFGATPRLPSLLHCGNEYSSLSQKWTSRMTTSINIRYLCSNSNNRVRIRTGASLISNYIHDVDGKIDSGMIIAIPTLQSWNCLGQNNCPLLWAMIRRLKSKSLINPYTNYASLYSSNTSIYYSLL